MLKNHSGKSASYYFVKGVPPLELVFWNQDFRAHFPPGLWGIRTYSQSLEPGAVTSQNRLTATKELRSQLIPETLPSFILAVGNHFIVSL